MGNTLSNENYTNNAFQNTLEWIYGYREYLQWLYSTYYDKSGNVIQTVMDITTPLKYIKYEYCATAVCGLASALLADDSVNITDVAKAILSCQGYEIKKEKKEVK
jgi:hypothetical protein